MLHAAVDRLAHLERAVSDAPRDVADRRFNALVEARNRAVETLIYTAVENCGEVAIKLETLIHHIVDNECWVDKREIAMLKAIQRDLVRLAERPLR